MPCRSRTACHHAPEHRKTRKQQGLQPPPRFQFRCALRKLLHGLNGCCTARMLEAQPARMSAAVASIPPVRASDITDQHQGTPLSFRKRIFCDQSSSRASAWRAALHGLKCMAAEGVCASAAAPMPHARPHRQHRSSRPTSSTSPSTATMRLMNTSSSRNEDEPMPLAGWKMMTSPGAGGLRARRSRTRVMGRPRGEGRAGAAVECRACCCHEHCERHCPPRAPPGSAKHVCAHPPHKAVCDLLRDQPVPHVKGGEH